MSLTKELKTNVGFLMGLILITLSFTLHLVLYNSADRSSSNLLFEEDGIYYLNYAIAVIYFVGIVFYQFSIHKMKLSKYDYKQYICALILFCISCFTLNIPFDIFAKFSEWVNVYLIIMFSSLLLLCFNEYLPRATRIVNFFVIGLGAVMTFYFAIYLLPFIFIGILGAIFFGLSLHLLAPLILFITYLVQFIKKAKLRDEKIAFYAGVILPICIVVVYTIKWDNTKELIHKASASIVTRPDNQLPEWILLSQELERDFFTERILKGDLVYQTTIDGGMWSFGASNTLSERKEHDPLVLIGSGLMGQINLDQDERIKILESFFDLRHETKRKLWSGEHLTTSNVLNSIEVFPEYRMAYSEKIIDIKNNYVGWDGRQEEALYTFYLPEGSVATSLSLWINGKEGKSRLTTKSKADSAYAQIVGVEVRDPSVMHWQEGNTLTVYVFPCTPKEDRRFKIGVTTPLTLKNDKLVLSNVYFDGPDASSALETTVIEFKSPNGIIPDEMPRGFENIIPSKYQYSGSYKPYWEIQFPKTELSDHLFSFNGFNYQLKEYQPKLKSHAFDKFFLDINKSWTKEEFEQVFSLIGDKDVYVYYDKAFKLTAQNKDQYFDLLNQYNFSLLPIHQLQLDNETLVISKSTQNSPNLADLSNTVFISELKTYLNKRKNPVHLFNLSNHMSPYIKTLKEFKVFNYMDGNTTVLKEVLSNDQFKDPMERSDEAIFNINQTVIVKDSGTVKSEAPDHLLRLFAYNKIMDICGRNYFTSNDFIDSTAIAIANEAYIVSPLSSLIVLESVEDYERFDIDENKDSLKNASVNSSGAVPEPHEWALIILITLTLGWLYYKRRTNLRTH